MSNESVVVVNDFISIKKNNDDWRSKSRAIYEKRYEDYQKFLYKISEAATECGITVISIREGEKTSEKGGIWEMKFVHKEQLPIIEVSPFCCTSQPTGIPDFKGVDGAARE